MKRLKPPNAERSDPKGGTDAARPARERHSGSGAASALASLKSIERKRKRATPREDCPR